MFQLRDPEPPVFPVSGKLLSKVSRGRSAATFSTSSFPLTATQQSSTSEGRAAPRRSRCQCCSPPSREPDGTLKPHQRRRGASQPLRVLRGHRSAQQQLKKKARGLAEQMKLEPELAAGERPVEELRAEATQEPPPPQRWSRLRKERPSLTLKVKRPSNVHPASQSICDQGSPTPFFLSRS